MKLCTRVLILGLVAVTISVLVGCSRHDNNERYILVTVNSKLPYWKTAGAGLVKAGAQYGVKVDIRGPETYDPQAEVKEFRDAVALKPAGILVSVADTGLMQPAINEAIDAGIPVITVDADAPASKRLYFIGTNNLQAGRLGGQRVVDKLHGKGNVVFYTMPQTNMDERLKGYKDVFADHPGIKIVEVYNIKGDAGTAFDRTQHWLTDNSAEHIDAFICLEASAGKDVAEAVKRNNATDRLIIAMDTDEATLNLVKAGVIDSTIAQKPYTMTFYGLKALDDIHHYPVDLKKDFATDSFSPFPSSWTRACPWSTRSTWIFICRACSRRSRSRITSVYGMGGAHLQVCMKSWSIWSCALAPEGLCVVCLSAKTALGCAIPNAPLKRHSTQ